MPKPYGNALLPLFLGFTLLILSLAGTADAADKTGKKHGKKSEKAVAERATGNARPRSVSDPETKLGLEAMYVLEYDKAIVSFQKAVDRRPDDPFALNHLLQAIMLQELFRLNALDTTLYADNGFLTGKPLPGDPAVKKQIEELSEKVVNICDARLKTDPRDVDALYARGVSRGLKLTYLGLVEKSFWASLRNAIGSRNDHDKVLEIDPTYTDAKLIVGVHNYILGSMPLAARIMAGVVGIRGDKKKGLEYLERVAGTNSETRVDARVALALFLRREAQYKEALEIMRELTAQYPRNFIFALETGNLLKDAGQGPDAVQQYTVVVKNAQAGLYPAMHIERAYFGLAEALKGQRRPDEALAAYEHALDVKDAPQDLRLRAMLGAGQMLDVLARRATAIQQYQQILTTEPDSEQAASARAYMKQPYRYPS
jgi:tetratricopeptide (TPR) repeat protein